MIKSKIKWAALGGLVLSLLSLLVHLLLAKYSSADLTKYSAWTKFREDFFTLEISRQSVRYRKLWGNVKPLESLQPYANPRSRYLGFGVYPCLVSIESLNEKEKLFSQLEAYYGMHIAQYWKEMPQVKKKIITVIIIISAPIEQNNGFIYAKIFGGFEKIRSSICDLVTISRLLNATLVIPEIQETTRSKGISSKFKSFSYLYNEEQFIAALTNDVIVVKSLPKSLRDARKRKEFPTFKLKSSFSPSFYIREILPKLKKLKVIGFVLSDGGGLQSILPPSMAEYQRLRCRVAFNALHFRPEVQALGDRMVERLRTWGQPYLAFHPGLIRDSLAYHGCAELFQDVHTELIQYRREQMIKQGIVNEELNIDSFSQRRNGSCPLMPEEVGLLLRAMGYPPKTIIYLAGSEIFGGQRVMIPLRAMYANLVDRTSLCSKQELSNIFGPETPLPQDQFQPTLTKSKDQLKEEWKKAGPRPRPLPPPPDRPIYRHEKEGWYGWITETDKEPDPSPMDLRLHAHSLLWDAIDYIVSVKADAFFPGYNNDNSGWPEFSSLVMGHRLYEMASVRTYRPDRKILTGLLSSINDHMYHPKRNWTLSVQEHLNKSLSEEGLIMESRLSKPTSFLSHPLPECSCRTAKIANPIKDDNNRLLYGGEDECPKWMQNGFNADSLQTASTKEDGNNAGENETSEDDTDLDAQPESDEMGSRTDSTSSSSDQDEEMDPDD